MEKNEILQVLKDVQGNDVTQENVKQLKEVIEHLFTETRLNNLENNQQDKNLIFEALQTYLKIHVCPIVIDYFDTQKGKRVRNNGSGVLMDLGQGKFLVTNKHVIDAYLSKVNQMNSGDDPPFLMIGNRIIDIEERLIDVNETLDLASIKIFDEDLEFMSTESYKEAYSTDSGPPSDYRQLRNQLVTFVGYPGIFREDTSQETTMDFSAFTVPVDDASELSLIIPVNLDEATRIFGERSIGEFDIVEEGRSSLGGFSGGGVFFLDDGGNIHLAAITKENLSFAYGIQATLSKFIHTDGSFDSEKDLYN